MSQDVAFAPQPSPTAHLSGTLFFSALALVTILPLAILPFGNALMPQGSGAFMLGLWVVTGFGHVMSTLWFALDDEYQPMIAAHRSRMITSLAVLPLGLAFVVVALPAVANWVIAAYWIWQAHHYNRQNYGVMAFAAAHDGTGPLPRQIQWVMHLTTCAGGVIMATMPGIYGGSVTTPSLIANVDIAIWHEIAGAFLIAAAGLAM